MATKRYDRDGVIDAYGDIFNEAGDRVGAGKVHVIVEYPVLDAGRGREARGLDEMPGTIQFDDDGPSGPAFDLVGQTLTMRLHDGRVLHFCLINMHGDIHVNRVE